jgi:SHS2 domain-containing protein
MSYEFLEHEADMGLKCSGNTLEEAFEEGGRALFDLMVDIKAVQPSKSVQIECEASDIATLFVEWLNELLSQKDIKDMFFSDFQIESITQENDKYHLTAKAYGEPVNIEKHGVKIEVKAATYSGLKYEKKEDMHTLQCIVDV